jgi:hypothetical protein
LPPMTLGRTCVSAWTGALAALLMAVFVAADFFTAAFFATAGAAFVTVARIDLTNQPSGIKADLSVCRRSL